MFGRGDFVQRWIPRMWASSPMKSWREAKKHFTRWSGLIWDEGANTVTEGELGRDELKLLQSIRELKANSLSPHSVTLSTVLSIKLANNFPTASPSPASAEVMLDMLIGNSEHDNSVCRTELSASAIPFQKMLWNKPNSRHSPLSLGCLKSHSISLCFS
ncbi:hypothetical protein Vadar_020169 [Vaccinium darrowii]|uniref:Uncharacterized protein n=1 Tax=Vaccinium darrowii TaxID=229202 RepID=A0ACB7ZKC0_9ERIC|nr:hypothetical protein Vadar_020169 [Vaccinium darrowii]